MNGKNTCHRLNNDVPIYNFAVFSLTGSGSVTVESVQRHSSGRYGNNDDGQMDFSLTAIDLTALRLHLSGVIGSNKDRWKELSVHGNALARTHKHRHRNRHKTVGISNPVLNFTRW